MRQASLVTLGETMGIFHGLPGESFETGSGMILGIGGAESNVAIAAARLGMKTTWMGRVGNDSIGRRVQRELRAEAVNVVAIVDPSASTGLMLKERRTSLHSRVWYYRKGSAGSSLEPGDLDEERIRESDVLHVSGITPGLSESAQLAVEHAIEIAGAANVDVSFDVNFRRGVWKNRDPSALFRSIAARSQIVFAGPEEARLLVPHGTSDADLARAVSDLGPAEVIVKRGDVGVDALLDGETYSFPAFSVPVIDTVGAGDAFVAGYLVARAHGAFAPVRLEYATKVAAFVCMTGGDWEGSPRDFELELMGSSEAVTR